MAGLQPNPDAFISQPAALAYWTTVSSTVDGMLGGHPQISPTDLRGSANFLAKARRQSGSDAQAPFRRAVDCGAGIGRITKGLLSNVADVVDIVEPVAKFTHEISSGADFASLRAQGRIGTVFNQGLETWHPAADTYDLFWHQWCLGQLNDEQLVTYLKRCRDALKDGGFVIAKENMSTHPEGLDVYDEVDSSVTRTDAHYRKAFADSGLKLVATEIQKGFPKGLYPVRIYAFQR